MKKILVALSALVALSSCTFVRIDTKALRRMLEEEGFEVSSGRSATVSAQGEMKTEVMDGLAVFTGIRSNIPIDIDYSDGDSFVSVSASANIFPYLSVNVEDSTLVLRFEGARIKNAKEMKAVIRAPKLSFIEINGAGDVDMNGHVETDDFRLSISGAGDVSIDDIRSKDFAISVSGAGDIDVDRIVCDSFVSYISGAGDLEVDDIEAQSASVSLAGAGDCKLAGHVVTGDFSVSGAGSIDIQELRVEKESSRTSGFAKIIK